MKKSSYVEYIKTSLITLLLLIFIAGGIVLHARMHAGEILTYDETALQNDMLGYLLTKYKHQEQISPQNAVINFKLGQLYEMLDSYSQAEQEYKQAILKRKGKYKQASFKLAGVYLLKKEYNKAEEIMAGIEDSSKYSIFIEKGLFYKSYGDALFNDEDYKAAIEKYNKALSYLKRVNSTYQKETEEARCDAYVVLADKYVSKGQHAKAIELLKFANEHCNSPIVMYKLGLLELNNSPEKSVELFEKVLKKNPSIINFSIYKKLLFALKVNYAYSGDLITSKLYDAKLIRLRSYMQRNVLNSDEIAFAGYKFDVKNFPFRNEYDFIYSFDITNITTQDIPKLFAIIEFYDAKGNKIYSYTENISPKTGGFKAGSGIVPIKIVVKTKKNLIQKYQKLSYKIYLTKNTKVSKLLYINNDFDVTKGKKNN